PDIETEPTYPNHQSLLLFCHCHVPPRAWIPHIGQSDRANIAYLHAGVKPSFPNLLGLDATSTLRRLFGRLGGLVGHLQDVDQLHVKDEGGARLDLRRGTGIAIGELRRTYHMTLAANLHVL